MNCHGHCGAFTQNTVCLLGKFSVEHLSSWKKRDSNQDCFPVFLDSFQSFQLPVSAAVLLCRLHKRSDEFSGANCLSGHSRQ